MMITCFFYLCVRVVCAHARAHMCTCVCVHNMNGCRHFCACGRVFLRVYECAFAFVCVCVRAYVSACVAACICVCICVCVERACVLVVFVLSSVSLEPV